MRTMIKAWLFFIFFFLSLPLFAEEEGLTNSVVKVFVTSNKMDYSRPWQAIGVEPTAGSGSIVKGNKILTNAHVVDDSIFIQVKKDTDPKKYSARVEAIAYDCDLALLTVEDSSFFTDTTPLELGDLPKMRDTVTVVGYPEGGGQISFTQGVISRVEVTLYSQSLRQLLTVQIDAAINPGNSGGPVVQEGKLVGIAMQVIQNSQSIGYMIPAPIISHFLKDLEDGKYNGFPVLGIDFNNTENPTLRSLLGLKDEEGGILITRILPFSSAEGNLKEGDVILEINDIPVGQDGTYKFRASERLAMSHIISERQIGEKIKFKVLREGTRQEITFPLGLYSNLVPFPNALEKPPYYIYGGLVFTVLSADFFVSWGDSWWEAVPLDFTYYLIGKGRLNKEARKELVILLNVLPDDINVGYHSYGNDVVAKVNGHDIHSFKDFVLLLNDIKQKENFTILETENNTRIVLSNKDIDRVNEAILKKNHIPQASSEDVGKWLAEEFLK